MPSVSRSPTPPPASSTGRNRRRFPRQPTQVKVALEATGRRGISFQATLPSADVSIGGIFLESEFFIKLGTELVVAFELPEVDEPVRVQGVVVREQRQADRGRGVRSGFAVEFTEFLDDAKLALASFFLSPQIRDFVQAYRDTGRHNRIRGEAERMVDVIVAWEMDELERGRGWLRA